MKKIVFAVTTDLNYDQRMQRICTSLAQHEYQVLLIGRRWPCSRPLIPQVYRQYRLSCFFTKGKLFYLEYNLRLFAFLLFRSFDAYGAIDLDTAFPFFIKAKISGKPFIYDAHEYFPEVPEVARRAYIKKIWTWLEQFIVSRTCFAYTVNYSLAALFKHKYRVPFAVIRNCTWLEPESVAVPIPSEKFLLYQGAVNEGRGLETLLRAMPAVDMKLVICGKGDRLDYLRHLSRELNISHKVDFKGYLLPDELKLLTRQAFLGINLLEDQGMSYYYSLGNKFFDYLHAGIPQLIVNFPEYQRLNETYGVGQVVALTPEAITAAINHFVQRPEYYTQLVQNCRRARLELNWQNEEKKLLAFYRNLWTTSQEITT